MNRLILIGNGFDLAHGLKTSVKDFAIYYFTRVFKCVLSTGEYEDDLVTFKKEDFNENIFDTKLPDDYDYLKYKVDNDNSISTQFHCTVINLMYNNLGNYNWLNIEQIYFIRLLQSVNPMNKAEVKEINEKFEKLKDAFIEYLKLENEKINDELFNEDIYQSFISEGNPLAEVLQHNKIEPLDSILFLNFNYTNSVDQYLKKTRSGYQAYMIHIHGNLNKKHGKPVFGYGDELNKKYLSFEEMNNNELFRHIKSFYYSLNSNYHRLTAFLDSIDFEVHIYGHSCGITDRTLLSQIFEHENCKSINVFYHERSDGTNDFVEKSYEIARHFRNKTMFRNKLVSLELSSPMPQNI